MHIRFLNCILQGPWLYIHSKLEILLGILKILHLMHKTVLKVEVDCFQVLINHIVLNSTHERAIYTTNLK